MNGHHRTSSKPAPGLEEGTMEAFLMMAGVFFVAFVFAPVGMGGGMLFVPLLHYGADWPIDATLLATSLCLTWAVSIGSGLRHRRQGFYHDASTKSALYGAMMGALLGVGIVSALGDDLDGVFKLLSIVMLVWALVKTYNKQRRPRDEDNEEDGQSGEIHHLPLRVGGAIGGTLSSVLGIGAGVIYVPVLQQQAGLGPRTSIGSSLSIMMFVVPVAFLALLSTAPDGIITELTSQPWWLYTLPVLAILGAVSGAKFGIERISKENIMNIFMMLVAIVLVRYVLDVLSFTS